MDHRDLLIDFAGRQVYSAHVVLRGITDDALHAMPLGRGNSVAWLVWHAARQQDAQVAHLRGTRQVWDSDDWAERLGVPLNSDVSGFGHTLSDVAALHVSSPEALQDYMTAVVGELSDYVRALFPEDLDEVVDTSWDPPVTRGVRLISTIDDAVAHLAQAAYARGLVEGWRIGY